MHVSTVFCLFNEYYNRITKNNTVRLRFSSSSSPLLYFRPDFYEAKWLPLYGGRVAVGRDCIAAYSAVGVLKGQQQIEIISFSPAWGIQTELHATAGEREWALFKCPNLSSHTLWGTTHRWLLKAYDSPNYATTHCQYANTLLAFLFKQMKLRELPACEASILLISVPYVDNSTFALMLV